MPIVRHRYDPFPATACAELEHGEIAWARIINGNARLGEVGKTCPAILVEARGAEWSILGLTTRSHYRNGSPRVAVPDPGAVGSDGPSWLWSERLCRISAIDVGDHIAWIDDPLAREVISLTGIGGRAADELLAAARRHHPGRPRTRSAS